MSADLIKRTSRAIAACKDDTPILKAVLLDCKAEIERLLLANETLKGLNADYCERIKSLAERSKQ